MNPAALVLWSIIRFGVVWVLAQLEAHQVFTKVIGDSAVDQIANYLFCGTILGGLLVHAWWQHQKAGLFRNSPYYPKNLPHVEVPTKVLNDNATVIAAATTANPTDQKSP